MGGGKEYSDLLSGGSEEVLKPKPQTPQKLVLWGEKEEKVFLLSGIFRP